MLHYSTQKEHIISYKYIVDLKQNVLERFPAKHVFFCHLKATKTGDTPTVPGSQTPGFAGTVLAMAIDSGRFQDCVLHIHIMVIYFQHMQNHGWYQSCRDLSYLCVRMQFIVLVYESNSTENAIIYGNII